ncbi:MAG: hypothetical protein WCU88_02990 [Elusimicrobiota bacterium]|jgi:hypothetical protein
MKRPIAVVLAASLAVLQPGALIQEARAQVSARMAGANVVLPGQLSIPAVLAPMEEGQGSLPAHSAGMGLSLPLMDVQAPAALVPTSSIGEAPILPSFEDAAVAKTEHSAGSSVSAKPRAVVEAKRSPSSDRPSLIDTLRGFWTERSKKTALSHPAAAESLPEKGRALFDGDKLRAYLLRPDGTHSSVSWEGLPAVLAADPDYREALARKGRIRLIVDKNAAPGGFSAGDAQAIADILAGSGISRGIEVENLGKAPKETPISSSGVGESPVRKSGGVLSSLPVLREVSFLARNLSASMRKLERSEVTAGLLSSLPGFINSMIFYVALFLPQYRASFAAMVALTVLMKAIHNVGVGIWTSFQNRLMLQRGSSYLTTFNFGYGQSTAALYRAIAWSARPSATLPPWDIRYWRDMSVMSVLGTVFYTIGNMAANELYNKGLLSRRGVTFLQQLRAGVGDIDGIFYKAGFMGFFWIAFAIHQFLDLALYPLAALLKARPILTLASEDVASTKEFSDLYLPHADAAGSPMKRLRQALLGAPFIAQFVSIARFLKRRLGRLFAPAALSAAVAFSPQILASAYEQGAAGTASQPIERVLSRLPRLTPVLDASGKAKIIADSVAQPVLTDYPDGGLGVFKPIRMPKTDPKYKYECMKALCEVVSSHIAAKMGVPTVRYRLAHADIDAEEHIGVVTPYLPSLKTLVEAPELADHIVNAEEFTRGAVIDAWLGNTDRIISRKNVWVIEDKGEARVLFGDYDQTFRPHAALFGIPKTQLQLLPRYAKPETLRRILADIAKLDDKTIRAWVGEALSLSGGIGDGWGEYFSEVLIDNRDELGGTRAFDELLSGRKPRMSLSAPAAASLADKVLAGQKDPSRIGAQVDAAIKRMEIYFSTNGDLRAPMRTLLEELARRRLAQEDGPYEFAEGDLTLLAPLIHFVWSSFEPAEAIGGGLEYHR